VTRYTYGDSDLAAERLALVAATFAPPSAAFLRAVVARAPSLAVDLGCGPGHTTEMVHAVTGAARTVGLDASADHVARAAARGLKDVGFVVHDATRVPFPETPADLVYARLLLAHLADPAAAVRAWATQLAPAGVLALDDLETIETEDTIFRTYLDDVALAVVRREGGALFVGPVLHAMEDPELATRIHDAVATHTPPTGVTARIFGMNLAVLVDRGETLARPDLAEALAAIADGRRRAEPVRWQMRQVAFRA
jgi:SAM-dependent methyltransferase